MHVEYVPCIWEAAEETELDMGCTEADALEVTVFFSLTIF